jgi:hypothetical protein
VSNKIALVILVLLSSSLCAQGQLKRGEWRYVSLPVDSVKSVLELSFSDSLHGYVGVARATPYLDTIYGVAFSLNQRWFRTSDGGLTWERMSFGSLFPDVYYPRTPYTYIGNNMTFWPLLFTPRDGRVFCVPMNCPANAVATSHSIIGSDNNGSSWQTYLSGQNSSELVVLDVSDSAHVLLYDADPQHHTLYLSTDGGRSLSWAPADSTFLKSVYPYSIAGRSRLKLTGACLDSTHWALALQPGYGAADTVSLRGLSVLITSDAGRSWRAVNHVPQDYEPTYSGEQLGGHDFPGKLQPIRGTSELYFMTGDYCEGEQGYDFASKHHRSGTYCLCNNTSGSMHGISFLYSSDYGVSWSENRSFGTRRRAFEGIGKGNVWMTAVEEDSIHDENRASLMLHSTNNGITWDTDQYALNPSDFMLLDGRILTFTDPDHGWCAAIANNGILSGYLVMMRYEPRVLSSVSEENSRAQQTFEFCKIYPNPAADVTTFVMNEHRKLFSVELYDMYGRTPRYGYHQIDGHTAEIDTHLLPTGLYLARINYDVGWFTENLVIVH